MSRYCTYEQVLSISDTDRTQTQVEALIDIACARINRDIQRYVFKEQIRYINPVKENKIDGTNCDLFVPNWPLGDYNDDFEVGTADVTVYSWENNVESELTVSSIDATDGKITLDSAPTASQTIKITYCYLPQHVTISHELIKQAAMYLTAWLCQVKVPTELVKSYSLDRLSVVKATDEVRVYQNEYKKIIERLTSGQIEVGEVK